MKISSSSGKFLLFLLVNLIVHLPFLNLPPCGAHVWRQCNTMAMSRNFATENMNILEPRIDRRNETDGLTGSHFPLYEWTLALISKVFGFSEFLARIYSLLIFTFGMLALYLVLLQLKIKPFAATCGGLLLLSVPQMYYDSINAMPDILALTLSLFALYFLLRYFNGDLIKFLIPAIIFSIAGGLIKFQFLIIPAASIVFIRLDFRHILTVIVGIICVIVPIVLWYRYALSLTRLNNLKEFGLWIQPVTSGQTFDTIVSNLLSDLPELLLGWPLLIFLIVFLLLKFKQIKVTREALFLSFWLLGFLVFYMVAIERMMHHSYYFMAVIPCVMIVFLKSIQSQLHFRRILIVLLVLNFTWSFVRIIPSRWTEEKMNIPYTFINKELRNKLENSIPKGTKCVVGPDISGCIYFYFTNTKGYSFELPDDLLEVKNDGVYIETMKRNGVRFLIFNQYEVVKPVLEKLRGVRYRNTVGEFQVWEIIVL